MENRKEKLGLRYYMNISATCIVTVREESLIAYHTREDDLENNSMGYGFIRCYILLLIECCYYSPSHTIYNY